MIKDLRVFFKDASPLGTFRKCRENLHLQYLQMLLQGRKPMQIGLKRK